MSDDVADAAGRHVHVYGDHACAEAWCLDNPSFHTDRKPAPMPDTFDLDTLLADAQPGHHRGGGRPLSLPKDVKDQRFREQVYRAGTTRDRALRALSRAHPELFQALTRRAREQVDAERGPLPGDDLITNGDTA